jgi:hypothetical protein
MKPSDPNNISGALPLEKINECPQGLPEKSLAHSKGKPGAFMTTKISVRFATSLPVEFETRPLKKMGPAQNPSAAMFLFQIKTRPSDTTMETL